MMKCHPFSGGAAENSSSFFNIPKAYKETVIPLGLDISRYDWFFIRRFHFAYVTVVGKTVSSQGGFT